MKTIGVITDSDSRVDEIITSNLKKVFENKVVINSYIIKDLNPDVLIDDDVILVMSKNRLMKIQNNIPDLQKALIVKRTINKKMVIPVYSIPHNEDVLVVNDTYETVMETVSLLYRLGINHLNLIPLDKSKHYENINYAITPGEKELVPKNISNIIDLCDRPLDISTFIEIINLLNLKDKMVNKRLLEYSTKLVAIEEGLKHVFENLYIKNEELETIINASVNIISLVDPNGKIIIANAKFRELFELGYDDKNINTIFVNSLSTLNENREFDNELVKYKGKTYNVSKKNIYNQNVKNRIYYEFKDVTYIRKLEQNLSNKLRDSGHIAKYTFKDILTVSYKFNEVIEIAKKIAPSEFSVLITGESGTGKELFAQSIHNESQRKNQPFIAVNSASMPETLLESQLFGYEKGTFTGGLKGGKTGLFEQAHNGTIFLDEIGDMSIRLQTKMLRVLQEKQIMPIGSSRVINIDVRIISATNKDLFSMIEKGQFRADLFYRLNVFPINLLPLRERPNDIIALLNYFTDNKMILSNEVKEILMNYSWPGNVRELQNAINYISVMGSEEITIDDLPKYILIDKSQKKEINFFLENSCNKNIAIKVLEIIQTNEALKLPTGRNSLIRELEGKFDINITEGKMRNILKKLENINLISSSLGRSGSKLTYKGKMYLKG